MSKVDARSAHNFLELSAGQSLRRTSSLWPHYHGIIMRCMPNEAATRYHAALVQERPGIAQRGCGSARGASALSKVARTKNDMERSK
jgi:hypothetical protein